jgi:hypothetical protein
MAMVVAVTALIGAAPASAHQMPPLCNSNRLSLDITKDRTLVRNGDTITYTLEVSNNGAGACDVSNVDIALVFPAKNGTPTGVKTAVKSNANWAGGAGASGLGSFTYTVDVSPGVTDVVPQVIAKGVLHDSATDHPFEIVKSVGTSMVTPGIEVDKVGSIQTGQAPANVTYTFTLYNRTSPPVPLDNVTVSDSLCPGAVGPAAGGDANQDGRFDPSEVWVYTCTMTHPVAGQYDNTVTACADLMLNGRSTKVCGTDNWRVTLTSPQGGVKPVAVSQAPCTLARVGSTAVRAGQLNTIRVRARNVDAGSTIKITLPGGKTVSAKLNKDGIATLRVRPPKSGTAKIEAPECSDVERLSVKPARRVVAQRAPRVTG